jgi:hypothetical protein
MHNSHTGGSKPTACEMAPLSYSEEILVTRSDLDEKNSVMAELRNKVLLAICLHCIVMYSSTYLHAHTLHDDV